MIDSLKTGLEELKLTWMLENCDHEVAEAARKNRPTHELIARLVDGENEARKGRAVERRLRSAKLPMDRTLEDFDWQWPKAINRDQIRHLFSLDFMRHRTNVVFIGTVGLGKTHIASALGRKACERGYTVLFTQAVDIINTLAAAQGQHNFRTVLRRYTRPDLLVIDELGYLPVDHIGAELLFQVLGKRYEQAPTVVTTNRPYKEWAITFANDAMLTSAVLDRVIHHCETVIIEGESYRMKDRITND
ncbi:MAG: ATP-binding protein [Lentisphaerae bacterium]|jgi:DNA replication protein DnaC|nr:ATP-binding protein [Lentisphaerota bacterium]MBT7056690.1 ATP-binding protein [Lentisphaerota bacterium]MBT7848180.1 ATP-binding protein [Lentisphaerota bacterium]